MTPALRIFDRLSASELAMFIYLFGVDAIPRLTNHSERIRQAIAWANGVDDGAMRDEIARQHEIRWQRAQRGKKSPVLTARQKLRKKLWRLKHPKRKAA